MFRVLSAPIIRNTIKAADAIIDTVVVVVLALQPIVVVFSQPGSGL
jgi:hypothetical protein